MYMVAFMYPGKVGQDFDFQHFVNVHLPLGLGLTAKLLNVRPEKIVAYTPTRGGDLDPDSAPYCAISAVYFNEKSDAETFCTLFDHEEAAERLSADFPNYTPHPPEVMTAEVHELTNISEMIAAFADR